MSRQPHARKYTPGIRARVKYAVLTHFPLRWWFRLPERTRDWWIRESQMRQGWSPMGRIR